MSLLALQSLEPGRRCAKRWPANGTREDYGRIVWWRPIEVEVHDIAHLHRMLARLATRADLCVVRGTLIDPQAARIRRASRGDGAGLCDGDRSWLCCDLDTLEPDDALRAELVSNPHGGIEQAGRWARTQLPAWLQDVTIVAQWSQSAGRDGYAKAKLHLWVWLDRPVCCASLAAWATTVAVLDPAVCRVVQPIYTSDPIIEDGWKGGPSARLALIRGINDEATPPDEICNLATHTVRQAEIERKRQQTAAMFLEADRYRSPLALQQRAERRMDACVRRALGEMAEAPESRRHVTLCRSAASIVRTARELGVDPSADLRALENVAIARLPGDRAHEPGEVVAYVVRTS